MGRLELIMIYNNNPTDTQIVPPMSQDVQLDIRGAVAVVRLARPAKRNALSDGLILALRDTFVRLPDTVRAAILQQLASMTAQ